MTVTDPAPDGLTPKEIRRTDQDYRRWAVQFAWQAIAPVDLGPFGGRSPTTEERATALERATECAKEIAELVVYGVIEHGDETPPEHPGRPDFEADYRVAVEEALNREQLRASLAEARLGHIADALKDWQGKTLLGTGFEQAVVYALAWQPDDTALAEASLPRDDPFKTGGIIPGMPPTFVVGESGPPEYIAPAGDRDG